MFGLYRKSHTLGLQAFKNLPKAISCGHSQHVWQPKHKQARHTGYIYLQKAPFPIYLDQHHKWFDFFNCEGTPHWILLTQNAEVFRSFYGSQENSQNRLYYAIEELLTDN